jgi:recombinational DNA repair protein (RecF pathway)
MPPHGLFGIIWYNLTMSYAIYKTEAIVLRLIPNGEANHDVVFFTRNFGKIMARAQSGRKHESKMRMFLIRFNSVTIDTVRGKSIWRLTGITSETIGSVFKNEYLLQSVYRMFRLTEFLIQGESPHPELFDFFQGILNLDLGESLGVKESKGLEIFCVIKILEYLGYWQGDGFPVSPTKEILNNCSEQKKELVKKINDSISATQIMIY